MGALSHFGAAAASMVSDCAGVGSFLLATGFLFDGGNHNGRCASLWIFSDGVSGAYVRTSWRVWRGLESDALWNKRG